LEALVQLAARAAGAHASAIKIDTTQMRIEISTMEKTMAPRRLRRGAA
jgi:hypothetical protein